MPPLDLHGRMTPAMRDRRLTAVLVYRPTDPWMSFQLYTADAARLWLAGFRFESEYRDYLDREARRLLVVRCEGFPDDWKL